MQMKKIYLFYNESYCIRRSLDSQKIYEYLVENDYTVVNNPSDADIILFITCASLDSSTNFSLAKIKEFKKKYNAELIVGGCLPGINQKELREIFNGRTLCTKDIDNIQSILPGEKIQFNQLDDANKTKQFTMNSSPRTYLKNILSNSHTIEKFYRRFKSHIIKNIYGKDSRFYRWSIRRNQLFIIRVSWGCNSNCAYCGIKNAIGPVKSKSLNVCVNEFKKGLKHGYKEFVINADDVGAYGIDINSSFAELLERLISIDGKYEISILDLSPRWIVKYNERLNDIFKKGKISRVDIPIQSGNTRILKLMNRYPNVEQLKKIIDSFKKSYPPLIVDTRLIVGFPSETKEEFIDTINLIKNIGFSSGYIYPYSLKSGTEAEKIEPKISQKEIKKRVKLAKKILTKKGYNFNKVPNKHFYFFEKQNKNLN